MKKLQLNSFVGGMGIYLFSNILNGLIPFILLPILTRHLGPYGYGEVAIFQTLLGALGAFVGVTFSTACSRKYFDDNLKRDELAKYIGSCVQLIFISSFITFIILFLFRNQLAEILNIKPTYIFMALITASGNAIIAIRLGQWQVRKQPLKYGILQVSKSFMDMILSLIFVLLLLEGSYGRINAQLLATLSILIISFYLLYKDRLLSLKIWRRDYLIEALRFGVPLIPHIAGTFLLTSVDRFVISSKVGIDSAGIFMVGVQLTLAIGLILDAINKAFTPWLYEALKTNNSHKNREIVKLTYLWFIVLLIGSALSFWIGPKLVLFIAGSEYIKAGTVIGWLVLGQAFKGMYFMTVGYIFYSKKTGQLSLITIGAGFLNIILLFYLVDLLGIEGAAIAFAFSMAIRFLVTWWLANSLHPMPWFTLIRGLKNV